MKRKPAAPFNTRSRSTRKLKELERHLSLLLLLVQHNLDQVFRHKRGRSRR